ncbi:thiopurine S-methyltransferase [Microbulbifer variabilis]|uniref:thiopurine S-methyltransferase n=1 Tax=Microbulbifer variabilis TaxID=266805 RepID=UPI00036EB51D|nr:thiopurine S-methyltransferase [Microbulbifer variabilis]
MEEKFWLDKWQKNEIGFHEKSGNPMLAQYFTALSLKKGSRIFLPLCGKTGDIAWLRAQGCAIAGAELSEVAVQQLFEELELTPKIEKENNLKCYSAEKIKIFVGDIFSLTGDALGSVEAIYDRAALVALPEEMRKRYTQHLMTITGVASQLLISFEYEQSQLAGPPFAIGSRQIFGYYDANYHLEMLGHRQVPGGLKGLVPAEEVAWLLTRR